MKKKFVVICVSLFVASMTIYADDQAQGAVQQANAACAAWGKTATPSTPSQAHGSVTYSTGSTSGTQNNGAQNTYQGSLGGNASVGVVSGNANGGVTRQGSQTNTHTQNQNTTTNTLYYQCK